MPVAPCDRPTTEFKLWIKSKAKQAAVIIEKKIREKLKNLALLEKTITSYTSFNNLSLNLQTVCSSMINKNYLSSFIFE